MFNKKTVFILGAGASWHYGYPTGEELVERVKDKAQLIADYIESQENTNIIVPNPPLIATEDLPPPPAGSGGINLQWNSLKQVAAELCRRIKRASPLVIDYFLGHNEQDNPSFPHDMSITRVGRACIAWVLLEAEVDYIASRGNRNRMILVQGKREWPHRDNLPRDDWHRFVLHKLTTGCRTEESLINDNHVSFITFNYDISLEHLMFEGLSAMRRFDQVAHPFVLNSDRFIHIYGNLRPQNNLISAPPEIVKQCPARTRADRVGNDAQIFTSLLNTVYEASKGIDIIAPEKATAEPSAAIVKARRRIDEAEVIYILGYGFDRYNCDLLQLHESCAEGKTNIDRHIMFTNFGDRGTVSKMAGSIFWDSRSAFLKPGMVELDSYAHDYNDMMGLTPQHKRVICEKSISNVYNALANDFDSPEDA